MNKKKKASIIRLLFAVFMAVLTIFFIFPLQRSKFTNPLGDGRSMADPFIISAGGHYYGTCTYNNTDVRIWKSETLSGLFEDLGTVVIEAKPDSNYEADIWAPEMYYLEGRWYLYFSGSRMNVKKSHVAEGGTDPEDPLCEPYIYKGMLNTPGIDIDASVIQIGNAAYLLTSNLSKLKQHIAIAKMMNPWTIDEDTYRIISSPNYAWELHGWINEAPEPLYRNGKIMIVYSASGCTVPEYCLGLLTFTGDDPLEPEAWTKMPEPIFKQTNTVWGPGHNAFFKSADGSEDWIVYHAKTSREYSFERNIRAQKFGWDSDDTPDLGQPIDINVLINEPSNVWWKRLLSRWFVS